MRDCGDRDYFLFRDLKKWDAPNEEDAKIVALSEIVRRDRSILDLADLQMGWSATRTSQNDDWQRLKD